MGALEGLFGVGLLGVGLWVFHRSIAELSLGCDIGQNKKSTLELSASFNRL